MPASESSISFSVRLVATASLAASMKSSMTWWLSSLTARCAPVTCPVVAQLDLDLGKRQLEPAPGEPPAAEDHRQLEHFAQHAGDLGRDAGVSALGVPHDLESPVHRKSDGRP